ncbi:homeobox-leucine zipper protein ATHB-7 [Cajanus cajan]|uniref:Homeobox-leucine zipper protein n=1 Tax=Cajanus cajan TaxID=3821 RepID=A0A151R9X7_CAJCA|nr:homeobox-leucine zipper protein ATHB-7 [Cajanus cajan]KYP39299.1 Homeobox-leucine zipper protein ATHB-52 [Cajanus cajan]
MGDLKFSFKTQDHVHQRAKHNKKRLTEDQVAILEKCFASNMKLEPEQKFHLANQLGVPPRQVAIWYQNKRARWKTQNLEVDHGVLQAKLENVMAEKKQLERDVERLKVELKKAQEMLLIGNAKGGDCSLVCKNRTHYQEDLQQLTHFIQSSELDPFDGADHSNTNNNGSCEFSTSFEEGGSSGVLDDGTHHHHECWQSGEVMQAEELYAYFMGANFGSGLLHEKRA